MIPPHTPTTLVEEQIRQDHSDHPENSHDVASNLSLINLPQDDEQPNSHRHQEPRHETKRFSSRPTTTNAYTNRTNNKGTHKTPRSRKTIKTQPATSNENLERSPRRRRHTTPQRLKRDPPVDHVNRRTKLTKTEVQPICAFERHIPATTTSPLHPQHQELVQDHAGSHWIGMEFAPNDRHSP